MSYDDEDLPDFEPNVGAFRSHNEAWAESWGETSESALPQRRVAVVACMDARVEVFGILGLQRRDAHVIRNAGGIVTDDVIRSLSLSQQALKTREIIVMHHTRCGVEGLVDSEFLDGLERATGERPAWTPGGFGAAADSVRASLQRLSESPFIMYDDHISGFVFDVDTGRLIPIQLA